MSSTQGHPETYTAYRWEEVNGSLKKVQLAWNDPAPGQVIVKVLACGVCGSDTLLHKGALGLPLPRVPGHEIVGDIVAVHQSETTFQVGQRVGAPLVGGYCGECNSCKLGVFTGCVEANNWFTGLSRDGGYAEYVSLSTRGICAVPEGMNPAEVAPLLCAGVTCHKGIEFLKIKPSGTVAIHGIGGLGHLAVQYARAMGFRTIAISSSAAKKDLALKLGAHTYIDESSQDAVEELVNLGGADAILATAPHSDSVVKLTAGLAYEGKVLVLGIPDGMEAAKFVPATLTARRWSIHGYLCGTARECQDTIEFSKLHDIKPLIETFPLEQASTAYDHRNKARFRSVISVA